MSITLRYKIIAKGRRQKSTALLVVGVARLELAASWSRTMRATICATPRDSFIIIMTFRPVVKVLFHLMHIFGLVQIY